MVQQTFIGIPVKEGKDGNVIYDIDDWLNLCAVSAKRVTPKKCDMPYK